MSNVLRSRLGAYLFERVAGEQGPQNRDRIHNAPGERWFTPDRPIRRVHGDAAMFVGGLTALLLQSLHPLAMAGVAGHSGYRGDPWGRLQRTSTFLAMTTYGAAADAQAAVDHVRTIHARVRGRAPDGRTYAASDPHLLKWVHVAEAHCFLRAYQRYGSGRLDQAGRDGYAADSARVAEALGVEDPALTESQLQEQLEDYRSELAGTAEARSTARFLLLHPPVPIVLRPPYAALSAAAVELLPSWARGPLWLPRVPIVEETVVRAAGTVMVKTIRWAMHG